MHNLSLMRQKVDANRAYVKPATKAIPLDSERMLAQSPSGKMGGRGQYTSDDNNPFVHDEP